MPTATPAVFPVLRYRDADAAIAWLVAAFGFGERAVTRDAGGTVVHAELQLGHGIVMVGQHRDDGWMGAAPPVAETSPIGLYVVVDDPDRHHQQARAQGAEIVAEPVTQDYGSREYSARDVEGILWSFGTYDPFAVAPADA